MWCNSAVNGGSTVHQAQYSLLQSIHYSTHKFFLKINSVRITIPDEDYCNIF